jgi:hypothetical protein
MRGVFSFASGKSEIFFVSKRTKKVNESFKAWLVCIVLSRNLLG